MIPARPAELGAVAEDLLPLIDAYGLNAQRLREDWNAAVYAELQEVFDRMRPHVAASPVLSSTWTEVLITRVELMEGVWRSHASPRSAGMVRLHDRHKHAVAELRSRALSLVTPVANPADRS